MPCPPLWSPTTSWLTSKSSIYISIPEAGTLSPRLELLVDKTGYKCQGINYPLRVPSTNARCGSEACVYTVSSIVHVEWSFSCPQHRWFDTCMVGWFPLLPYLTLGFLHPPNELYLNSFQGLPLEEPKLRQGLRGMRTEDEVRIKDTQEELGVWLGWHSLKVGTLGQADIWVGVKGYVKDLLNLRFPWDILEAMLRRQLALWVWSSEEGSGVERNPIRIIRAVHDLFWGVGVAVPEPSPESRLIFSPRSYPDRRTKCKGL